MLRNLALLQLLTVSELPIIFKLYYLCISKKEETVVKGPKVDSLSFTH